MADLTAMVNLRAESPIGLGRVARKHGEVR